jgi:RTX calcium-binding nonapeptide repeat (4 copies)
MASIFGDAEDSILTGTAEFNLIYGGRRNDTIYGYAGHDTLFGGDGAGRDTLYGGDGNDSIHGGGFAASVYDFDGYDTVYGGPGRRLDDGRQLRLGTRRQFSRDFKIEAAGWSRTEVRAGMKPPTLSLARCKISR